MRFALVAATLAPLAAAQDEHRLPEFDLGSVEASYVVSVPKAYDKAKTWPLILDFHGAIAPKEKGARVTRDRLWAAFVEAVPCIVAGPNGRTRAWGTAEGDKNDKAYALRVLADVRTRYAIDERRIYLAGFSSGSDFLCRGNLQLEGPFAASLVCCPGPPNVVGLRQGELLRAKAHPFLFATGEADYPRKDGAWQAFLALEPFGKTLYREVAGVGHEVFPVAEYARLFAELERLAHGADRDPLAAAREALARGDYLDASARLAGRADPAAAPLRADLERAAAELVAAASAVNAGLEPGRAYEAWWRVRTQLHRFQEHAARAEQEMQTLVERTGTREMGLERRRWFRERAARAATPKAPDTLFAFDRYLGFAELEQHLQALAARHPSRVRLLSLGKSVEGRDVWLVELTEQSSGPAADKPAALVVGALHGNEISAVMSVLYAAWQCAANPAHKTSVDKLMGSTTLYLVPAANPDALHHHLAGAFNHWRPRFNMRPYDADGDGRVDEDGDDDLDGDGEIGLMYKPDPSGAYVLQGGRLVRGKPLDGGKTYTLAGAEGIDDDGDGKSGEDPKGGVDLNRNFPIGFTTRGAFKGTSGPGALSEPETRAIADFVAARPNVAAFFDVHNDARCLFYWTSPQGEASDVALYERTAKRAQETLGYPPKPLSHEGAGLAIAWAYGQLGLPAFLVELEPARGDDQEAYRRDVWKDAFLGPKPVQHPQLGEVLVGNDWKKIAKRNPHPVDIVWQAQRSFDFLRGEVEGMARLQIADPRIELAKGEGRRFVVTGEVRNSGQWPTDTAMAKRLGKTHPVRVGVEGAAAQEVELGSLVPGESKRFEIAVEVRDPELAGAITLVARHPRAGLARLSIARPRHETAKLRTDYAVEAGFATPDAARRADNAFYKDGVAAEERGPAFPLLHAKDELKVAVLLGEWQDLRHKTEASVFEQALFSRGSYTSRSPTGQETYGSLRDFYDEMSYGRMQVTGRVFDWVELSGTWQSFRAASFGSPIVQESLEQAVLARYGPDALDGYDGYVFVWAGNTVARTSALWPMRIKLSTRPDKVAFKMGELHQGEFAAIGVACHELGHTFGVNDKYGLGATPNPLGPWCLMSKGTHGGEPSGRHRPFHMCAWCKMVIGWVRPTVIDPATPQKLALRPITFGPGECYRVLLVPDGSEYLLLENRRREGFFTDLPSPGLVVLRVGPNDQPANPQTRVQLLPAHGLPPVGRGLIARPAEVAWPQPGKTELVVGCVRLSGIRLADDVVYLEVSAER